MLQALLANAKIVQNAYVVNELHQAMQHWQQAFGIGPFLVMEHIQLSAVEYRGRQVALEFSAAFVQCGELNIELIQQHSESPSAFRDMFPQGSQGFHHCALFADDFDADIHRLNDAGYALATLLDLNTQGRLAFIDTRPLLGHMLELYENRATTGKLFDKVREAAGNWDGKSLTARW